MSFVVVPLLSRIWLSATPWIAALVSLQLGRHTHDIPRQCNKKQRHHSADKDPYSQSYGFSSTHVQMWELDHNEGWAQRIDAFELWCWSKLLRVPWTARSSNQSIVKEINPEYSLEGLIWKLKRQFFSHLMQRAKSLVKTPMLGKIEGRRRRGNRGWGVLIAPLIQWTWVWASSGRWWRTGKPSVLQSMGSQSQTRQRLTNNDTWHSYIEYVMLKSLFYRLEGKIWDYIFNNKIKVYLPSPTGSFMGETVSSMLITVPGTSLMYPQLMTTWIQGCLFHGNGGVSSTDLYFRKKS